MGLFARIFSFSLLALSSVRAAEILPSESSDEIVPNSYIVVMNDGLSNQEFNTHRSWAASIHHVNLEKRGGGNLGGMKHTFDFSGMKGYSGVFDEETIQEISSDTNVCILLSHPYLRETERETEKVHFT